MAYELTRARRLSGLMPRKIFRVHIAKNSKGGGEVPGQHFVATADGTGRDSGEASSFPWMASQTSRSAEYATESNI
jgi:hypothetical protein